MTQDSSRQGQICWSRCLRRLLYTVALTIFLYLLTQQIVTRLPAADDGPPAGPSVAVAATAQHSSERKMATVWLTSLRDCLWYWRYGN